MRRLVAVLAMVILAGCGGSSSPVPGSPAPAGSSGENALATAGAAVEGFLLCPAGEAGTPCPLPPASYVTNEHDSVGLTVSADGWQEEPGKGDPNIVLSRVDAPDQRLIIDVGDTGDLGDDAYMLGLLSKIPALQALHVAAPQPATIGDASGFAVDVAPSEAISVSIAGAGTYELQPDHRYRIAVLQHPMDQESVIEVVIVDAPAASFDAFGPVADELLDTVQFSPGE